MTLKVPISAEVEAKLREKAAAAGQPLDLYAARVLAESASAAAVAATDEATIALLRSWNEQDATSDPAEIAAREREWQEFARSINQHHSSSRKVYP